MSNDQYRSKQSAGLVLVRLDSRRRALGFLILLLLVAGFSLLALNEVNENVNPEAYDTTAFLGEANTIVHHGGLDQFLLRSFGGQVEQANQHFLYSMILSLFASHDISFFIHAKLLSAFLGLLVVIVLFVSTRRRFGDGVAAMAAFGMLLTPTFLQWSAQVGTETLLLLMVAPFLYFTLEGFGRNRYWWMAGTFAGLAYMTKGTALFLLPGFPLAVLAMQGRAALTNRHVYGFFIMFVVAASPLLVRNAVRFQNPVFNINTHRLTYSQEEIEEGAYTVFDAARGGGINVYPDKEDGADAAAPRSEISVASAARRVVLEVDLLLETLNPWPLNRVLGAHGQRLFGIVVFGLFLLGLGWEGRGGAVYVLATTGVFVLCLSLFNDLHRYLLPVVLMVWIYAACGVGRAVRFVGARRRWRERTLGTLAHGAVGLSCVTLMVYSGLTKDLSSPGDSVEFSDSRADLLGWLRENVTTGESYSGGPNFNWQLREGTWVIPPRNVRRDLRRYTEFAFDNGTDYVVLDRYSLTVNRFRGGGVDRQEMLRGFVRVDDERGLVQIKEIPGWHPVYMDSGGTVEFIVFEIVESEEAREQLARAFEGPRGVSRVAARDLEEVRIPSRGDWQDQGPVLRGDATGWDRRLGGAISPAGVVKLGDTYILYYIAASGERYDGGPANRALGAATSTDGVNFQKYAGNPVITHQPSLPDGTNVVEEGVFSAGASIDSRDGTVAIVFGGMEATGERNVDGDVVLAKSGDGLRFDIVGDVIDHADPSSIGDDELFPVGLLQLSDERWVTYYLAKGGGHNWSLAAAFGSDAGSFSEHALVLRSTSEEYRGGGDPVLLSNRSFVVPILRGTGGERAVIDFRVGDVSRPADLSRVADAQVFEDMTNMTLFLDRERRRWFLYYLDGEGETIRVKTAPMVETR